MEGGSHNEFCQQWFYSRKKTIIKIKIKVNIKIKF